MNRKQHARWSAVVAATAAALILVGCAPGSGGTSPQDSTNPSSGGGVKTDVSAMGKITLTVWDQETTPGISDSLDQLNKEFHTKYPNVTIDRKVRSGTDLRTTLKLALTGKDAPDVIQANQGYADMGAYVKANLIENLAPWNKAYGWSDRIPSSQLALDSVTADGSQIGQGNLYGVSITGEVVGTFYNKKKLADLGLDVPSSVQQLEVELPKIKAAGQLPISYGDQNKSPGIHLWGIELIPALGQQATSDLVFGQGGSWTDPKVKKSAQALADWAKKGYLTDGYLGITSGSAATAFGKGDGVFFLGGVWNQDAIQQGLGKDAGFAVLPESDGGDLAAMGGVGMGWAIPTHSDAKDAAAAYIDFISNSHAMEVLEQHNQLPAVPSGKATTSEGLGGDVLKAWGDLTKANGLVPYIDWATPTFYDTISSNLQELMGGKQDVNAFAQALQDDYSKYLDSKKK